MRDGADPTDAARCVALERALGERTAELERTHRLHDAISTVNRAVLRSGSPESLFDEVARALVSLGGFRMAWVGRHDRTTNEVLAVARAGDDAGCLDNIRDLTGRTAIAVREGRSYVCNDLVEDPRTKPITPDALLRKVREVLDAGVNRNFRSNRFVL